MKRAAFLPLLLTIVVLNWAGTSPALAYYPPLQDVTVPTVVQDTETKVNVSVHDPATGQDIPGVWSITGGVGAIAIDQIVKNQGMVAWRVQDLINNKYMVVAGVYDPNPHQGWQFFSYWGGTLDYLPVIVALNDGVLLYECQYTTGADADLLYHTEDYIATYDPALEMPGMPWIVGWRTMSYSWTSYTDGVAYGHVVKDGAAAFVYYSPTFDYHMNYLIYDSRVHAWMTNHTYPSNPTVPAINAATVTWTDDEAAQKRGYDYTDMSWKVDQDTKVMANFVFAPFEPRANQFVYFTDMSIGANAWSWMTGDGFTTGDRSFSHKYIKPGQYTAKQDVTGPAGFNTISQTVPVKSSSLTGPLLLLLLGD
jgi:hypothetical protein